MDSDDCEQGYYTPVTCPKCQFAKFDLQERKDEWIKDEGSLFHLELPTGEIRGDMDVLNLQCPICQAKIKVELVIDAGVSVHLMDDD